jgi:hypothetical protein
MLRLGMTHEEIACTLGTTEKNIQRILRRLARSQANPSACAPDGEG